MLCPPEGLSGSELCPVCSWAVGAMLCSAVTGSTLCPSRARGFVWCWAVRCVAGCQALIQSGDAIGFTSALEIWDSAGRGSGMHPSRRPAQSVWPWESVPVASVATSGGYSSRAGRCQPLGPQDGVPWGHVPQLAPGQRIPTPRDSEFCQVGPARARSTPKAWAKMWESPCK